jgi:hypothetical protein
MNYELSVPDRERRFRDMNMWTPKKRDAELDYARNNPVKRGLVKHPGERPWSSWRFCLWDDGSTLGMDKMLCWHRPAEGRIHPDKNRRDVCATRGQFISAPNRRSQ